MKLAIFLTALPLSLFVIPHSSLAAERPNIVIILADDLGYPSESTATPKKKNEKASK